ncbi:MAG: hypothetical protein K8R40_04435 [Anaerolineaceae bacterium]|nr:hypothetical protein [Anaerolineaceae bacterium]
MDKVPSLDINKLWIIKVEKYLINSDAETDDDINYYNGIAFQEAFQTARNVVTLEPCVDELFDQINATILDKNHNGWISVEWKLSELPRDEYLSQEEWGEMYSNLEFIYLRTKPTLKYMNPPIGACTWEEIRNNVHQHLSGEISKPSASIYLFIDEQVTVWANWQVDATEEPLEPSIPSTLMNLVHEMECLYPPPDLINFNVSDLEHNIVYYGVCQRPDDGDWPDSIVLDYYRVND